MTEFVAFQLTGGREMVSDARALELIDHFDQNIDPISINLSNKSFSPSAAAIIVNKVKSLYNNVKIVNISDVIAGKPDEEALETMTSITAGLQHYTLNEIDVSDNALGKPGILACKGILQQKSVEKLFICNNGLSAEASVALADILLEGGCPPLKVLQFYNNMAGNGGAVAISRVVKEAHDLQEFRFSATRSFTEGCCAVAESLNGLNNLVKLDLSDNNFDTDAAEVLSNSLEGKKSLVHLNVRDAGLTEEGVIKVMDTIVNEKIPLKYIDLSGNDITVDTCEDVAKLLIGTPSLEEIYLDDNEITSDGVQKLTAAIKNLKKLRILSICHAEISAAGAYLLAKTVAKIATFQYLKLDGNEICSRGVEEIRSVLGRAGKILGDMDDNDEDGEDDLESVLEEETEADLEDESISESLSKIAIA